MIAPSSCRENNSFADHPSSSCYTQMFVSVVESTVIKSHAKDTISSSSRHLTMCCSINSVLLCFFGAWGTV